MMWPSRRKALEQTTDAEAVVEDLYSQALFAWAPIAAKAVLPSLDGKVVTAAAEPPPNPDALASTQPQWEAIVASTILPGVAGLWAEAATTAAAAKAVGGIPDIVGLLADTRDQFLLSYGTVAALVPGQVRDELKLLIRDAPDKSPFVLRSLVRDAITPGSTMLRKVSRRFGFTAASILNHALMGVAKHAGKAERIAWISRRDDRVRPTHRIADGQIVPIGSNFSVGGVDLAFPGDPRGPAREVISCRCRLVALAAGEAGPQPWVQESPLAASSEENTMTVEATPVEVVEEELYRTFTDSAIAFIGVPTTDRRVLAPDIDLSFRTPPLPLMWMRHTGEGGHTEAYTVGVIEDARMEDGRIVASGYLLNTAEADEAATQLEHGVTRPSVDLGGGQWVLTDENGAQLTEDQLWDLPEGAQVFTTFTHAELMGMTLVATPAFGDTSLTLNTDREPRSSALAAAVTVKVETYAPELFSDPKLAGPTRPTMDPDTGRVYGHLAEFGHTYRGGNGEAVPRNRNGYANFHTSQVHLDNGKQLAVGRLTVKGGHAPTSPHTTAAAARAHYDNVCATFALVRVGEDAHGIWFSGIPAPGVDPEVFQAGMTAPLSGDWRDCGQGCLDMIAVHAVCSPGFPIYSGSTGPDGRELALVATLGPGPDKTHGLTFEVVQKAVAAALKDHDFIKDRDSMLERAAVVTLPKTPREQVAEMLAKAGL